MSDEAIRKVLAGLEAKPYGGRSDLYRWLRTNHRRLSRKMARLQATWAVLAEEVASVGVKNTKGQPPSVDSVRRIWATVCRDLEAEAGAKAKAARTVGRKMPSRISPEWRPAVVPPAPIRPKVSQGGSAAAHPGRDAKDGKGEVDLPPEAQAEKARALGALDELDRKTFGVPK
jgi:hypothetical protein